MNDKIPLEQDEDRHYDNAGSREVAGVGALSSVIRPLSSEPHQADPIKRARLRWRSRRGLLENDLILTRFLDANEATLTDEEVEAFTRLLELSDSDLMNLMLQRNEPGVEIDTPSVRALIQRLRIA